MLRCAMRRLGYSFVLLILIGTPLYAADPLSDARRLYNQGQYDAAEQAAREAARFHSTADGARVVLGRIQLERYRRTPAAAGLTGAIGTLREISARRLDRLGRL